MPATPTSEASGSQTSSPGTEHTLATTTDSGVYVLTVDVTELAGAETLTLRVKTRARLADTTRLAYAVTMTATEAAANPISISPPVASLHECIATLEQTGGSARVYPWNLIAL